MACTSELGRYKAFTVLVTFTTGSGMR